MYTQGSKECLANAEHLLKDATLLLQNKSFGATQSLMVTAIEEVGKAIILELANLNYVGEAVVEQAMRDHLPKNWSF
jgi:AbiV family abortive infection protein